MKNWKFSATCLLLLPVLACSGGNDSNDLFGGGGQGSLTVQVYDVPVANLEAAMVTFTSLQVHPVGATDWLTVDVTAGPIDLLSYVGPENAVTIGTDLVPAGSYDGLRFTISEVTLTVAGEPVPVPLPEGGISATVPHDFTVAADGTVEVEMHLNPAASFQVVGTGYTFTPTVDQVGSH